ncbi:MAG: RNA polymerase sigma factor [Phycisphaerae bacterium]|nr:RNA polymerase sigma factor [Phycisphaerae bacterium]
MMGWITMQSLALQYRPSGMIGRTPIRFGTFTMDNSADWAHITPMDEADQADIRNIRATLAGDGEAYSRLICKYQNEISARMWRFSRDRRELEELVHDVFVEAYVSLKGFKARAPFSHWLNRIATRVGYRLWKKLKRRGEREAPLQDWDQFLQTDPQEPWEPREAAEMVHTLLAQLRPRDRLVLTLMYLDELSVNEIAERTGWSKTMVKVQVHRARNRLKALMADLGIDRELQP